MKKYILRFLLILWACGYYSCSDPELVVLPDEDTSITGKALYFSPSYLEVSGSSNFTIDIHISEDIVDLIGAEIEFTYDKTLVSFHSAKIGLLLESAIENVLISEDDTEIGRVLLTLAFIQDGNNIVIDGVDGDGSIVQVSFTPLVSSGFFKLKLDLSLESLPTCTWHDEGSDHSIYTQESEPHSSNSFSSLINATIFIVE